MGIYHDHRTKPTYLHSECGRAGFEGCYILTSSVLAGGCGDTGSPRSFGSSLVRNLSFTTQGHPASSSCPHMGCVWLYTNISQCISGMCRHHVLFKRAVLVCSKLGVEAIHPPRTKQSYGAFGVAGKMYCTRRILGSGPCIQEKNMKFWDGVSPKHEYNQI